MILPVLLLRWKPARGWQSSNTLKLGGIFGRHCRGEGIMISSTSNRPSGGQLRGGKSNGTAARFIPTVKNQGGYRN